MLLFRVKFLFFTHGIYTLPRLENGDWESFEYQQSPKDNPKALENS
jgi:hypothetical protein